MKNNRFWINPEGNIINESQNVHFWGLKYLKMEGDWLYVEGIQYNIFRGWIRWRKDRKILVTSNIPIFQITQIEK